MATGKSGYKTAGFADHISENYMIYQSLYKHLLAATVLSLSLFSLTAQAGDAAAGKDKAQTCMGCHGVPGYFNVYPSYRVPKIWGQTAEYIVSALNTYKSGQRSHETMTAQASTLSDADMADIAAFFAATPATATEVKGEAPAESAVCTACHGAGGGAPIAPINPILAGQYEDYLLRSLRGYQSGERKNPIMGAQVGQLTDAQLETLAAWFASQDGLQAESN